MSSSATGVGMPICFLGAILLILTQKSSQKFGDVLGIFYFCSRKRKWKNKCKYCNQQPIFCCQIIYHIIHFFYRKNKDLSPITGQVSTIKQIHPFYPKLTPENTRGLLGR